MSNDIWNEFYFYLKQINCVHDFGPIYCGCTKGFRHTRCMKCFILIFGENFQMGYRDIAIIVGVNKQTKKREIRAIRFPKHIFKNRFLCKKWIENNETWIFEWEKEVEERGL